MLLLTATTDKFQLVTDAAVTVDVHASYMDNASGVITPGRQNTAITTATTTDIVGAPGASTQRNVKTLTVRNKHASSPVNVTLLFDQNGTDFEIIKVNLLAGSCLQYVEGMPFVVIPSNYNTGTGGLTVAKLGSDHINATTTPTEVTGLSVVGTGTGTFVFNYYILHQADAATTGIRFDVNHTGTVTSFVWNQMFVGLTQTAADANPDQDEVLATASIYNAFSSRGKGTAGRGTTLSVDTLAADMLMRIEGLMVVTVDGDLELWHGSEVAANTTVKAGSSLLLVKTG